MNITPSPIPNTPSIIGLPESIATLSHSLIEAEQELSDAKEVLARATAYLEGNIWTDRNFSNDVVRKARKAQVMEVDENFQHLIQQVKTKQQVVDGLKVEIQLMRDRFMVARLLKQEEIARLGGEV